MGCICVAVPTDGPAGGPAGGPAEGGGGGSVALLNYLILLKSSTLDCAKKYRKYGERYHELPLRIRNHDSMEPLWMTYCSKAFIISANDEVPDLIQVFAMAENKFEAVRRCVFKSEVNMAKRNLFIAATLVGEAEVRVKNLRFGVEQYEQLLEAGGKVDEVKAEIEDQKGGELDKWKAALPKCCGAS